MACLLAASVVNTPTLSSSSPVITKSLIYSRASSQNSTFSFHITINLKTYNIKLKERMSAEIRNHVQSSIKTENKTQWIVVQEINKEAKSDHRYFLFLSSQEDKIKMRVNTNSWLSISFPNAFLKWSLTYKVKINNMLADSVINDQTNKANGSNKRDYYK